MFKAIKEFFTGKQPESKFEHPLDAVTKPAEAPPKVETPAEPVQPVVEVKVDPVAVALDLEPLDLAATAEPAKKPRKPRAPKVATAKPAVKKAPATAKAPRKTALKVVKKTK
jgi:hypothetical protein